MPIDPKLVNCDLCILAYQNYHQAVLWPLDPWYEILARGGSDRRSLFMTAVHKFATSLPRAGDTGVYSGPASIGRLATSNASLDPILTNHRQINPKLPAFTGDGSVFLVLQAPSYITENLRSVRLASYASATTVGLSDVRAYGAGTDEMIVFEGATGSVNGSVPAFSPMGYVLKRYPQPGPRWDAHIVFRGSRSGSAGRAIKEGSEVNVSVLGVSVPVGTVHGNADWVTDLCSTSVTGPRDIDFAGGEAAHGFIQALKWCFPTILLALQELSKQGAPDTIHVTGHSLGAALASTLSAALTLNVASRSPTCPARQVRTGRLADWPWDGLRGWYYALPPTGPKAYCDAFRAATGDRTTSPYCDGDMVVECSNSVGTMDTGIGGKAGWAMGSGGYSAGVLEKLPKPASAASGENPHEIYLIRDAIVRKLGRAVPTPAATVFPWGVYKTFSDVLGGRANILRKNSPPAISIITAANLRAVLQNYGFASHYTQFLDMLRDVMANKDAYVGKHFASTLARVGENIALARSLEVDDPSSMQTAADIADRVGTQVSILCAFKAAKTQYLGLGSKAKAASDGSVDLKADDMLGEDFSARIGLGMLLSAVERYGVTTMADYERLESLRLCMNVELS